VIPHALWASLSFALPFRILRERFLGHSARAVEPKQAVAFGEGYVGLKPLVLPSQGRKCKDAPGKENHLRESSPASFDLAIQC